MQRGQQRQRTGHGEGESLIVGDGEDGRGQEDAEDRQVGISPQAYHHLAQQQHQRQQGRQGRSAPVVLDHPRPVLADVEAQQDHDAGDEQPPAQKHPRRPPGVLGVLVGKVGRVLGGQLLPVGPAQPAAGGAGHQQGPGGDLLVHGSHRGPGPFGRPGGGLDVQPVQRRARLEYLLQVVPEVFPHGRGQDLRDLFQQSVPLAGVAQVDESVGRHGPLDSAAADHHVLRRPAVGELEVLLAHQVVRQQLFLQAVDGRLVGLGPGGCSQRFQVFQVCRALDEEPAAERLGQVGRLGGGPQRPGQAFQLGEDLAKGGLILDDDGRGALGGALALPACPFLRDHLEADAGVDVPGNVAADAVGQGLQRGGVHGHGGGVEGAGQQHRAQSPGGAKALPPALARWAGGRSCRGLFLALEGPHRHRPSRSAQSAPGLAVAPPARRSSP